MTLAPIGPDPRTEPEIAPDGSLTDFLTGVPLEDSPEERVRQRFLRLLHHQYGYPKATLRRQVPINAGRGPARDATGKPTFADICVYLTPAACAAGDQAAIKFVVETKAPDEQSGHNQLVSYIFNTGANGGVWYNGEVRWYRRYQVPEQRLVPWPRLPRYGEPWDRQEPRAKRDLSALIDVRRTLQRCHNKLHRRGSEGDDLTMDMVRILLAKARDEERDDPDPLFYCTPDEYANERTYDTVLARVETLFEEVRNAYPTVFDPAERIRVGSRQVVEVVTELQDFRLIGEDDQQWDVMGAAYEQYTAELLKREGGEFFTNRLVTNFLARMIDISPDHVVLDPAGGTGGFATAAMRAMRRRVRAMEIPEAAKRRRLEQIKDRIHFIDIKHRLVKIAKAAMILTGNGHRGFTQGDSLSPFDRLPADFLQRCHPGVVDRVLTNPPFAGTNDGKIDAPNEMVPQFQLARRWHWRGERYEPDGREPVAGGVPPELLFIERCVQWLKPGGIMGIVVPKGVLENPTSTLATRHFIFRYTFVRAVIACHKNTFQPYTGSRTALLVLQKKTDKEIAARNEADYPIFMAISRKIGQDSEGVPIFTRDDRGRPTTELDHDLDQIYGAWEALQRDEFQPSEYTFVIRRSQLNPRTLLISPQSFLPSLNEAIATVVRLGESDQFTTQPLRQLASNIYKGTRFKREDLETDTAIAEDVVRYYTPAALLQDHSESIKYLDLSRAEARRRDEIEAHGLRRLELLVTRSGSIGRVILTTAEHAGHVGSDDLIHIDIPNEELRLYVYQFLKSDLGQKQMKKDEYGTIQQHLEPAHLREVLVPVPSRAELLVEIADRVRAAVRAKEESSDAERAGANLLAEAFDIERDDFAGELIDAQRSTR